LFCGVQNRNTVVLAQAYGVSGTYEHLYVPLLSNTEFENEVGRALSIIPQSTIQKVTGRALGGAIMTWSKYLFALRVDQSGTAAYVDILDVQEE
jgi:hypothetical protein